MLLYPQPHSASLSGGACSLSPKEARGDLLSFFRAVRAGLPGIVFRPNPALAREAYTLSIGSDEIRIGASCDEGLFRAVTSLCQLFLRTGGPLPCMEISDWPELPRRGYMLDISRGKKPKVSTLRTMIDFLASLKYNEFQLYMEGGCFKYAAYPEETADYDCLTPEDILELDRYCRDRFVDLVPNQNSLGHMYTWLKKPAFHHLGLFEADEVPSTLNPLLPESFDFVCSLYASLLPYFSSSFVNIGLDEAYGLGRYQIEEYCREKGKDTGRPSPGRSAGSSRCASRRSSGAAAGSS